MTKIAGSGSISQRHGSADPDPDPPQNVMDPQHCWTRIQRIQQDGKGDVIKVLCFERCCGSAIRIGFNANTDPDPTFYLNADPDPGSQTNADPDPDPG